MQPKVMADLMKEVPIARLGKAREIVDAVGHALPVDDGYTVR